jgi:hypothetical protein
MDELIELSRAWIAENYGKHNTAHYPGWSGAHLGRDCAGVGEQEQQDGATQMQDFLLDLHDACEEWRLLHLRAVPLIEHDDWVAHYFEILAYCDNSSSCKA